MKENARKREKVAILKAHNDNEKSYAPASFCGTAFMYLIQPSRLTCSSKNE